MKNRRRHDPPFAFGNVGVKFWNWPLLRDDFSKALAELTGHRMRLIYGKFSQLNTLGSRFF
jgi:hypothetical protein